MTPSLRRALAHSDGDGYSMVELLVIVLIIGILAAIAIPVYLSQRGKSYVASMRSDLANVAPLMESYLEDHGTYPNDISSLLPELRESPTNVITVVQAGADQSQGYCLKATNPHSSDVVYFDSLNGGVRPLGETCQAR